MSHPWLRHTMLSVAVLLVCSSALTAAQSLLAGRSYAGQVIALLKGIDATSTRIHQGVSSSQAQLADIAERLDAALPTATEWELIRAALSSDDPVLQSRAADIERRASRLADERTDEFRELFDIATSSGGFDLIKDGLSEWALSVTIDHLDNTHMRFEGSAVIRWRMPFTTTRVDGHLSSDGVLLIEGIEPASPVVLSGISPAGFVSGDDWSLEPWTQRSRNIRDRRDSQFAALSEQEFVPTVAVFDGNSRISKLAAIQPIYPRMQVRPGKYEEARSWFDGKFDSGFDHGVTDLSVSVRYVEPARARGLVLDHTGLALTVEGVSIRINGGSPIGVRLPPYTVAVVDFGTAVDVGEILVEARAGRASFTEIALLGSLPNE